MLSSLLRNLPMFEGWLEETINPDFFWPNLGLTVHEIHFMGIIVDSWKFWDWSRCSLRKSFAQRIKFYNSVLESAWTTNNTTFSNLQAKNNDKLWTKRSRREMLDKIIEKWVINDYLSLHCRQSWVIQYWQTFFWTLIRLKSWNMENLS